MPQDLKDYLPDLDTVRKVSDRDRADEVHRRALDDAKTPASTAESGRANVNNEPPPAVNAVRPARGFWTKGRISAAAGLSVVMPVALLAMLVDWDKQWQSAPGSAGSATVSTTMSGAPETSSGGAAMTDASAEPAASAVASTSTASASGTASTAVSASAVTTASTAAASTGATGIPAPRPTMESFVDAGALPQATSAATAPSTTVAPAVTAAPPASVAPTVAPAGSTAAPKPTTDRWFQKE